MLVPTRPPPPPPPPGVRVDRTRSPQPEGQGQGRGCNDVGGRGWGARLQVAIVVVAADVLPLARPDAVLHPVRIDRDRGHPQPDRVDQQRLLQQGRPNTC